MSHCARASCERLSCALVGVALLVGCSGSSDSRTPAENETGAPAQPPPVTQADDAVAPDPMVQNVTTVEFDITVPVYVSNALLVRLSWGDKMLTADWIGDEMWTASNPFPTATEHVLSVTFHDDNGAVTLGSFEQQFRTGENALERFVVTADQFDTDRWDDDGNGVSNIDQLAAGSGNGTAPRVLLFSETRDYRHDAIPTALTALQELSASSGMRADLAGDSAGVFTDENLAEYDAVVWVLTSGDVLNADEQAAFERYIRSGRGYAGIHAASDTEYEWPWYGRLVGAYFERHPVVQSATQHVEDGSHPSTRHLPVRWTRTDEWYDYRSNPRAQVNVLLSLDESSYADGGMGEDHPSAWYHAFDGGRSWYTGGGHTDASYAEPAFRQHLIGGLRYAVGAEG